jgi:hypothetical protein
MVWAIRLKTLLFVLGYMIIHSLRTVARTKGQLIRSESEYEFERV